MNLVGIKNALALIENTNPEDIYERFEDAWLAIMGTELPQTLADHSLPMEPEERFRALINLDAWESAAEMLTWPTYTNHKSHFRWEIDSKYLGGNPCAHVHHTYRGDYVLGDHPFPGVALLIAILRAYEKWHEFDLAWEAKRRED
jgi:hypothetical protein